MPQVPARERIARASLELFGRKGIAGTTVQDIARRAGCSQAAIYKYWDGKDALARELFDEAYAVLLRELTEEVERWEDPTSRVAAVAVGFLRHARRHPPEHALLFQVFHTDYVKWMARREKPSDRVAAEISAGIEAGAFPPGDVQVRAAIVLGMAIRIAVFERQGLIVGAPEAAEADLSRAVRAVLAPEALVHS